MKAAMGQKNKKHKDSSENLNKALNTLTFSDVLGIEELPFSDEYKKAMESIFKYHEIKMIKKREEFDKQILEQFINTGSYPRSYSVTVSGEYVSITIRKQEEQIAIADVDLQ